jgi:DNA polymerase I
MHTPKKKLFLLDAMALIYRAHFAFIKNKRINSKGMNTGAVLGFTNALVEVINKESPTHLVVAFDTKHTEKPNQKTLRWLFPMLKGLFVPFRYRY